MHSWFYFVAAVLRLTRPLLVRVFALVVVCASFLIAGSEAFAGTVVSGSSTPWTQDNSGATCKNISENCTAFQACESYRLYSKPTYIHDRIELQAGSLRKAVCYIKESASAAGNGWTSITSNMDYVAGPPEPNCTADKGKVVNTDHYTVSSPSKLAAGVSVCIPVSGTSGGCSFAASGRAGGYDKVTGKWEYQFMGPLTHTGTVCTGNGAGATDPVKDDNPTKCGAGMCTATVNGVESCVKCAQTDTATNVTKTTTNPDGSTTQVTTNTSTTINNNNVTTITTTITTTTPAGGGTPTTGTKTETTSESKDSYCQRNPNDAGCKDLDGQASGGETCVTPPVCNGDAVQCMMVQQQWLARCQYEKQTAQSDLATQILAGNDPGASSNPAAVGNREVRSLADAVEQTPFLNGGGGLQDKVFVVNGRGITFPFSKLNPYLVMIGNVFVAISLIGAARIVLGVK